MMSRRLEYHTRTGLTLSESDPVGTDPNWIPNTDVYESEDHSRIFVVMELAGVDPKQLQVVLVGRVLLVRGERPDSMRGTRREFQQMEISYGQFERRVRVGGSITALKATARHNDGFLIIELPKVQVGGEEIPALDEHEITVATR